MKTLTSIILEKDSKETNYWFINIFHAIGGVLTAIFIILLIGTSFSSIFNNYLAMLILGAIFLFFSFIGMAKIDTKFAEYFVLIFALVGGGLIVAGLVQMLSLKSCGIGIVIALVYIVLYVLINSIVHRFISFFLVLLGSYYLFVHFNLESLYSSFLFILTTWLWVYKNVEKKHLSLASIASYTLIFFVLFITNTHDLLIQQIHYMSTYNLFPQSFLMFIYYIVGPLAIYILCRKYRLNSYTTFALIVGTILFYYTQPLGIDIAKPTIVLLIAFYRKSGVLTIFGTLSLIYSVYIYYAITFVDFLTKSKQLAIFGLTVLTLTLILHLYLKKNHTCVK